MRVLSTESPLAAASGTSVNSPEERLPRRTGRDFALILTQSRKAGAASPLSGSTETSLGSCRDAC